nr:hypothetical protein [Halomonas sp.]
MPRAPRGGCSLCLSGDVSNCPMLAYPWWRCPRAGGEPSPQV